MPRLPIDYANTIIYKIVCNNLSVTDCYVGHTTDFVRRKQSHKRRCTNEKDKKYNYKIYKMIRENQGWENFTMVEIEKFPCENVFEACKRERYYYELLNSTLNSRFPQRSIKEWSIANKEIISLKSKKYCKDNKNKIAIRCKEWYQNNKEEIAITTKEKYELNKEKDNAKCKEYRENNKQKIAMKSKEYRNGNKEQLAKKHQEWYEKNKEQVKEKNSKIILCDCGKEINYAHKSRHLKTKVHNDLMLLKNVTSV
jgi:hypothetical protein